MADLRSVLAKTAHLTQKKKHNFKESVPKNKEDRIIKVDPNYMS